MSDSRDEPSAAPLGLFEGYGIEIEYMIVEAESLDVAPRCDSLMRRAAGEVVAELDRGAIAWSNELVLHVVELKTNGPAPRLEGLAPRFQAEVAHIDELLAEDSLILMPTAMHPWMDPAREAKLWPHEYGEVYRAFDSIFGCRGHGWSNLQSLHVNLPFSNDDELRRLHGAIRLVLPLLPALAASSPFVEGESTGLCDSRLAFYRDNCARLPAVTGRVVPEVITGRDDYRRVILDPIAAALAPFPEAAVLDPEWVNARGSIARFVRDSLEIRVIDVQEHPGMDLAVAALACAVIERLTREVEVVDLERHPTEMLAELLEATTTEADRAEVNDVALLRCLGVSGSRMEAGAVWAELAARTPIEGELGAAVAELVALGPLARRIVRARERGDLREIYGELCACLRQGHAFHGN
jgi:glutamate---cysteine ligase / carboxylate-amine ligase